MFRHSATLLSSCGRLSRNSRVAQKRQLNLHEYQSKQILERNGCSVQKFVVAKSVGEAEELLGIFKPYEYVVKAQVLAGGRGKGHFLDGPSGLSGVHISYKDADALRAVEGMLGRRLVTKQTAAEGVLVDKVMIAEGVKIARECSSVANPMALSLSANSTLCLEIHCYYMNAVASPAGGMDIEQVAEKTPELIFKEPESISEGLSEEQARRVARNLQFSGDLIDKARAIAVVSEYSILVKAREFNPLKAAAEIRRLYELFLAVDATQIEINPLVETADRRVFCVDAKMNFDDSASFRQQEIFAMEDYSEQDPREVAAHKHNLNYIGMEGNIACLVNGAGLAMATMDVIKLSGGEPANFLDVGGSVTTEQVKHAFDIITSDPKVRCVLVNIFGGIVNCATIAQGIIAACAEEAVRVPVVVRLEGTNVKEGLQLLEESNLQFTIGNELDDAVQKAVKLCC